jgi:hypothetical protein
MEMTLQFDVDVADGRNISNQLLDLLASFFHAAVPCKAVGQRTIRASGQADNDRGHVLPVLPSGKPCTFAFFRAQLHFGDQAAKVLITGEREAKRAVEGGTCLSFRDGVSFRAERGIPIPCTICRV